MIMTMLLLFTGRGGHDMNRETLASVRRSQVVDGPNLISEFTPSQ